MPVCLFNFNINFLTTLFSLCNTVCTTKQWSPETDPVRLDMLQHTAREKIEARDAQALELKYACYPSTRPQGWAPATQQLIDTDEDAENNINDDDDDYYNAYGDQNHGSVPTQLSQHFQEHLAKSEAANNPPLNSLFGQSLMERVNARAALLQERRRPGRPKKADKSSSGGRLPNGKMSQQLNGTTLDRHVLGPSPAALKGVTERCGGIITPQVLVNNNIIPGRIQVHSGFNLHFFSQYLM